MNRLVQLITTIIAFAIALAGAEFLLRLTGHRPYQSGVVAVAKVEPPGAPLQETARERGDQSGPAQHVIAPREANSGPSRQAPPEQHVAVPPFDADSELGYRPRPGRYVVAPPGMRPFSVTLNANSTRITHQDGGDPRAQQAWFFGCSFTYGWGLNDEDTFAWKIRQASNELDVINFGVSGYGNVHGLIQFRRALQAGHKPKFVAVVYASFHDERNALLRFYRKNHMGPGIYPYAKLQDGKLVTVIKPVEYTPWPLQRDLAMVEFAENAYNRNEYLLVKSQQITKAVLREFVSLASAHSVPVVVFGIWNNDRTREVVSYSKTIGAIAADVSEDLEQPGGKVEGDGHPSAAINDRYARKMIEILREHHLH